MPSATKNLLLSKVLRGVGTLFQKGSDKLTKTALPAQVQAAPAVDVVHTGLSHIDGP